MLINYLNKMSYGSLDLRNLGENNENQQDNNVTGNASSVTRGRGLSVLTTTLFIAGQMAGSGILALPKALADTGYIGIVLLIYFCVSAAYCGMKLGDCWNIIEQRYPEHRTETRNPYSVIALKAVGKWGSVMVSWCIRFTLFGAGTVYLLLSAQITESLLKYQWPNASFCLYFIIIASLLIPVMWLGTPKEFSIVGVGAILSTVIACILYFVQIIRDANSNEKPVEHKTHGFGDFFLSFGTMLFAFGGASTFPTLQNDMENKHKFTSSINFAFAIVMVLYLPITLGGFFVYGDNVKPNVIMSLTKTNLVHIGDVLMAIHLICAFLIVMNTVCQDVEEAFGVPKKFNWRRCFTRTVIVVLIIIVGESVPQFGLILSLVGGSTITLLTFVLPPYFYMKLCKSQNPNWERRLVPLYEKLYLWELIGIGVLGGITATFNAMIAIFGYFLATPCYMKS